MTEIKIDLDMVKVITIGYLNNLIKLNKKIEAIGVAFSFQESNRLPISNHDFKLNKIYTENGFVK